MKLVWPEIIADLKRTVADGYIADLVILDARRREQEGDAKYQNGSFSTAVDKSGIAEAYEESLDQLAYLKLEILKRDEAGDRTGAYWAVRRIYVMAIELAAQIRSFIEARGF